MMLSSYRDAWLKPTVDDFLTSRCYCCPFDGYRRCKCCRFAAETCVAGLFAAPSRWRSGAFAVSAPRRRLFRKKRAMQLDDYVEHAFAVASCPFADFVAGDSRHVHFRESREVCPLYSQFLRGNYSVFGGPPLGAVQREDRVMWLFNFAKLGIANARLRHFWGDADSSSWGCILDAATRDPATRDTVVDIADLIFALALHWSDDASAVDSRGTLTRLAAQTVARLSRLVDDLSPDDPCDREISSRATRALCRGVRVFPLQRLGDLRDDGTLRRLFGPRLLERLDCPRGTYRFWANGAVVLAVQKRLQMMGWLDAPSPEPATSATSTSSCAPSLATLSAVRAVALCHRAVLTSFKVQEILEHRKKQMPSASDRRWRLRSVFCSVPDPVLGTLLLIDLALGEDFALIRQCDVLQLRHLLRHAFVGDAGERWTSDRRVRTGLRALKDALLHRPSLCDAILDAIPPTCATSVDAAGNRWLLTEFRELHGESSEKDASRCLSMFAANSERENERRTPDRRRGLRKRRKTRQGQNEKAATASARDDDRDRAEGPLAKRRRPAAVADDDGETVKAERATTGKRKVRERDEEQDAGDGQGAKKRAPDHDDDDGAWTDDDRRCVARRRAENDEPKNKEGRDQKDGDRARTEDLWYLKERTFTRMKNRRHSALRLCAGRRLSCSFDGVVDCPCVDFFFQMLSRGPFADPRSWDPATFECPLTSASPRTCPLDSYLVYASTISRCKDCTGESEECYFCRDYDDYDELDDESDPGSTRRAVCPDQASMLRLDKDECVIQIYRFLRSINSTPRAFIAFNFVRLFALHARARTPFEKIFEQLQPKLGQLWSQGIGTVVELLCGYLYDTVLGRSGAGVGNKCLAATAALRWTVSWCDKLLGVGASGRNCKTWVARARDVLHSCLSYLLQAMPVRVSCARLLNGARHYLHAAEETRDAFKEARLVVRYGPNAGLPLRELVDRAHATLTPWYSEPEGGESDKKPAPSSSTVRRLAVLAVRRAIEMCVNFVDAAIAETSEGCRPWLLPGPRVAVVLVAELMYLEGAVDGRAAKRRHLENKCHPLHAEMAAVVEGASKLSRRERGRPFEDWLLETSVVDGLCVVDIAVNGPTSEVGSMGREAMEAFPAQSVYVASKRLDQVEGPSGKMKRLWALFGRHRRESLPRDTDIVVLSSRNSSTSSLSSSSSSSSPSSPSSSSESESEA